MPKEGLLHHIEINVSDLQTSGEFWKWLLTEKFSYKIFQKWENGVSFKYEDTYIVLVQTKPKHQDRPFHRKKTGLNHLAFHCPSKAFVDSLTKELKSRNIKILYEDNHPYAGGTEYYAVFFEDPDRIKVEVVVS